MNPSPERFLSLIKRITLRRGAFFGGILLLALFAFEIFNYSTTDFALTDMLGASLRFLGIRWATILSLAFCGIDFAGIARLFTPEQGRNEPTEVWYLFGAWLLAAAMNAILTWWGVAVAIRNHQELSALVIGQNTLTKVVPVFVALMVWLIRVLIIGTFSMAGERLFSIAENRPSLSGNAIRSQLPLLSHSALRTCHARAGLPPHLSIPPLSLNRPTIRLGCLPVRATWITASASNSIGDSHPLEEKFPAILFFPTLFSPLTIFGRPASIYQIL